MLTIFAPLILRITQVNPHVERFEGTRLCNMWETDSMALDDRTIEELGGRVEIKGLCICGNCPELLDARYCDDLEQPRFYDEPNEVKNALQYETIFAWAI